MRAHVEPTPPFGLVCQEQKRRSDGRGLADRNESKMKCHCERGTFSSSLLTLHPQIRAVFF